jgi:hypothetical protein
MDGPRGRNSGRRPLAGWHPFEPRNPVLLLESPQSLPLPGLPLVLKGNPVCPFLSPLPQPLGIREPRRRQQLGHHAPESGEFRASFFPERGKRHVWPRGCLQRRWPGKGVPESAVFLSEQLAGWMPLEPCSS